MFEEVRECKENLTLQLIPLLCYEEETQRMHFFEIEKYCGMYFYSFYGFLEAGSTLFHQHVYFILQELIFFFLWLYVLLSQDLFSLGYYLFWIGAWNFSCLDGNDYELNILWFWHKVNVLKAG